jgi:K+ transporter
MKSTDEELIEKVEKAMSQLDSGLLIKYKTDNKDIKGTDLIDHHKSEAGNSDRATRTLLMVTLGLIILSILLSLAYDRFGSGWWHIATLAIASIFMAAFSKKAIDKIYETSRNEDISRSVLTRFVDRVAELNSFNIFGCSLYNKHNIREISYHLFADLLEKEEELDNYRKLEKIDRDKLTKLSLERRELDDRLAKFIELAGHFGVDIERKYIHNASALELKSRQQHQQS